MGIKEDITASNAYVESELVNRLEFLEATANADVITIISDILPPIDDMVREVAESRRQSKHTSRDNVFIILETNGGSIETAERLADLFRHHWRGEISFVVPNYAMSAGTILVMSGDHIYMDYFSVLGPIDPQVRRRDGGGSYVPALGYLEKYDRLIERSRKGTLTAAEMAFLIEKFDPAELDQFEKARDLSIDLLKKWLVQNKFKNWTQTRTRGLKVTQEMREARATQIAKKLNDVKRWKSHGRGLSIAILKEELNLIVEDYGTDKKLSEFNSALRSYYRLLQDYMKRRGWQVVIQTRASYIAFGERTYETS